MPEAVVYLLELVHVDHHHHGRGLLVVAPSPRGFRLLGIRYHLLQLGPVEEPCQGIGKAALEGLLVERGVRESDGRVVGDGLEDEVLHLGKESARGAVDELDDAVQRVAKNDRHRHHRFRFESRGPVDAVAESFVLRCVGNEYGSLRPRHHPRYAFSHPQPDVFHRLRVDALHDDEEELVAVRVEPHEAPVFGVEEQVYLLHYGVEYRAEFEGGGDDLADARVESFYVKEFFHGSPF